MADSKTEDEKSESTIRIPKEHAPLDYLLSQIPKKAQKGMLIQCDLHLNCIDANDLFIALGSNVGVVFLYNRKDKELERLRTHSHNDVITSVAIHSGLENKIAVGTEKGMIYLFQLPSVMPSQSRRLQQFIVNDIHKSEVACICWSLNGMKMFSGDKKGLVSCTEVDFYAGVCETNICLIESNCEIVQLSHAHKALLISTNRRSLLYRTDIKTALVQVGQKDRKVFGKFGAVFMPGLCKTEDAELYACRPGLRIWKSKIDGTVSSTFLFKELINNSHPTLELLPFNKKSKMFLPESQFGPLYLYKEKYIVTWSDSSLFIVNPYNTSVIGGTFHAGNILSIAVTNDEIFLLRKNTDRNVIRIAERPESLGGNTYHRLVKDKDMPEFMTEMSVKQENLQTSPSPFRFIKDITDKIKNLDPLSEVTSSISDFAESLEKHTVKKELPPIVKLDNPDLLSIEIFTGDTPAKEISSEVISSPIRRERFNPFSKEDFNECDDDVELDTSNLSMCNKTKSEKCESSPFITAQSNTQSSSKGETTSQHNHNALQQGSGREMSSATAIDRIRKVPLVDPTDDIAVSVKTKKKKKKKTDNKSSPSTKIQDSDTASQNSAEGVLTTEQTTSDVKPADNIDSTCETAESPVDISDIIGLRPKEDVKIETKESQMEEKDSKSHLEVKETKDGINDMHESMKENMHLNDDSEKNDETTKVSVEKVVDLNINVTKTMENIQKSENVKESVNIDHVEEKRKTFPVADSVFKSHDTSSSLDIASKVLHPKKQKESALSKLEKNLASLEEGLVSGLNVVPTHDDDIIKHSKDHNKSLNLSQTDSGNGSMQEEKDNLTSSETKVDREKMKEDAMLVSPAGASSPTYPTSDSDSIYKSQSSSCDDFYSKYNSSSSSPVIGENTLNETSEHTLSHEELEDSQEVINNKTESVKVCDPSDLQTTTRSNKFNTWTEVITSGNLMSLTMSDSHIWCTDKSSNIWYSSTKTPGIKWQKANGYANQISVSRSGMIVWRLYKDTVYAGTKITSKHPEGMKWVEAIRGVQSIYVDNLSAWYIKANGEVAMQKRLSKDRPCYKSTFIECSYKLQQIACRSGVVWAINDQCKLVYRAGIKKECPEGKEWVENVSSNGMMFSSVCFGDGNVAWAMDILGRVYFITDVTMKTPLGDNCWWQVPINNEVATADVTLIDTIKSLTKKLDPQKLADLLSKQQGGLITAGFEGIWVCPECKNTLQHCRTSIEGHLWNEVNLSGIVASTAWKLISVSALHLEWGIIWIQQANGELFTFDPSKKNVKTLERPSKEQFVCMGVCEEAVWGLNEEGKIFIRSGIASHCPQGAKWCDLDLKQLGDVHLIHLSCGTKNVWAVDDAGIVYQRIGVKAPTSHSLPSAWLPVDLGPTGTTFIQVFAGPSDYLVWAIDNKRQTYVRIGVTDFMPIGTSWLHIPGAQVHQLAISHSFVWALEPNGEVLCRHGVTIDNPGGDYWRKIPGIFVQISCSINDKLWAIGCEGQIFCRKTRYLMRKESAEDTGSQKQKKSTELSAGEDWELI